MSTHNDALLLRFVAPVVLGAFVACGPQQSAPPTSPTAPAAPAAPAPLIVQPTPGGTPTAVAPAPPPPPASPPPLAVLKDVGLDSPESVAYDAEQDVFFVSNIAGTPFAADSNGFISKVSADGKLIELKFVDGAKKGSTLNAPKGIAVSGPFLYVADLTFVRIFDRKKGTPRGKILAPGATFLMDVAAAPDGTIYVTDGALKPGANNGFEPTGTDAIYKIGKNGRADKLIASKDLGSPNGIVADATGVWFNTFGTSAIVHVSKDGKADAPIKVPGGLLDGLVRLPDGSLLVTSWMTSTVYRGTPGGPFEPAFTDKKSPADIGYDSKRHVLVIPNFLGNTLEFNQLPGGPPAPAIPPTPAAPPAPAAAKTPPAPAAAPVAPAPKAPPTPAQAAAAPAPAAPPAAAKPPVPPAPAAPIPPVMPAMAAPASPPAGAPATPAQKATPPAQKVAAPAPTTSPAPKAPAPPTAPAK
jgi:sugar lactone lactonase YvrE